MFRKSLVAIALLCAASLSMADTVYVNEFKPGPVVGVYYQAVVKQRFEVFFTRK